MEFTDKQINQFRKSLIQWYNRNHRSLPWRETSDPYYIWVSEVMLQQTQVNTVIPYYQKFIDQYPTVKDLSSAPLQRVLKSWEGLGYYSRARNLHKAAKLVVKSHMAMIPDNPPDFQKLPGVGDYICAAVQSIAFHHPLAVVDGNVKRVLARIFQINEPVNSSKSYKTFVRYADQLLSASHPGTFNQAVMELGAMICKPTQPVCGDCPVQKFCLSLKKKQPVYSQNVSPLGRYRNIISQLLSYEKMAGCSLPYEARNNSSADYGNFLEVK